MSTIAKLLIQINGDTSGLTAALDKSTASVRSFANTSAKNLTASATEGVRTFTANVASHLGSTFRPAFDSAFQEAVVPAFKKVVPAAVAGGEEAGDALGKSIISAIHRHRSLIPGLAAIFVGLASGMAGDIASADNKIIGLAKGAEKAIEQLGVAATFFLPPLAGAIVAVVSGTTAALIGLFVKAKEDLHEFTKSVKTELDGLINTVDQLGLQKKLKEIEVGRPSGGLSANAPGKFAFEVDEKGFFKSGLDDLLALQEHTRTDLKFNITAASRDIVNGGRQALEDGIKAREPLIAQALEQQKRIRDALLHPLGGETGGGGQIAGTTTTGPKAPDPAKQIKDFTKTTGDLLGLFTTLGKAQQPAFDVALRIHHEYDALVTTLAGIKDPWSDQAISLRKLKLELEQVLLHIDALKNLPPIQFAEPTRVHLADQTERSPQIALPNLTPAPLPAGPSLNEARFTLALSVAGESAVAFGGKLKNLATGSFFAILQSIASQLNPFSAVVQAISVAAAPLVPFMTKLANIVAATLVPIFEAFAPVLESFLPLIDAIFRVLSPILTALAPLFQALVPLLTALFPILKLTAVVFTYVAQAVSFVAGILFNIAGGIAVAFGALISAIGRIIAHIPGVSGLSHDIQDFGSFISGLGKGFEGVANGLFETSDAMAKARDAINAITIDPAQTAIDALGKAASGAAGVLNGPQGFKYEWTKFMASASVPLTPPTVGVVGSTKDPNQPASTSISVAAIYIDAKNLTAKDLFEMIKSEAQKASLAKFGTTTRAAEALA